MDNCQIRKVIAALSAMILLPMQSVSVAADAQDGSKRNYKERVINSVVATGLNDVLGRAPFDLGEPFGTFGFSMVGIQNKNGGDPLPLTPNASDSDILVTVASQGFLTLAGKTRADVPPGSENIPLRDVPINVDFASVATNGTGKKVALKGVLEAGPIDVAQAEPADPITLGQWMKANGTLKIICESNDLATFELRAHNMLPNRIYGVGSTLGGFHNLPVDQQHLAPFTIGGVPHLFVTDEHGNGEIVRTIKFCPLDPQSADRTVLVFNLLLYSRHQNYGAVPEPVFVNGLWLGMVTHNHLQFPINVKPNPEFASGSPQ